MIYVSLIVTFEEL